MYARIKLATLVISFVLAVVVFSYVTWLTVNVKSQNPSIEPVEDVYAALESGKWGWANSKSDLSCQNNPHSIQFRSDYTELIFKFDKKIYSADETTTDTVVYTLKRNYGNRITMTMVGEKRVDDSGQPVIWELVMLNSHEYAWHRYDWKRGALTPRVHMCKKTKRVRLD